MVKPLGVQLYSVREYAKEDFVKVLKKTAEIGYKVVEPAGFFDLTPAEFKKIIDDLGLEIYSSHRPWAHSLEEVNETVELLGTLGLKNCVCGYGPDSFKDMDAIKRTADNSNALIDAYAAQGITMFQHNHYWEFERLDGKIKYEIYDELCPRMKYEIDCFWSTNKGSEDAVEMLKKFADKCVLIHMKDGVCKQQAANAGMKDGLLDMKIDLLPLGTGTLPIPELIKNAPEQVSTVIVELDYCEIEMWKALEMSYKYMTENGLAAGNK